MGCFVTLDPFWEKFYNDCYKYHTFYWKMLKKTYLDKKAWKQLLQDKADNLKLTQEWNKKWGRNGTNVQGTKAFKEMNPDFIPRSKRKGRTLRVLTNK